MVVACIYLEGGANGPDSKLLSIECRKAFHKLLEQMGFKGRMPKLVACGGRQAVFDRFRTAHESQSCDYVAMWIDSEEPMLNIEEAWRHLANVTTVHQWQRPGGAADDQVLFKTRVWKLGSLLIERR